MNASEGIKLFSFLGPWIYDPKHRHARRSEKSKPFNRKLIRNRASDEPISYGFNSRP